MVQGDKITSAKHPKTQTEKESTSHRSLDDQIRDLQDPTLNFSGEEVQSEGEEEKRDREHTREQTPKIRLSIK